MADQPTTRYTVLTGPDTHEFCERVSQALDQGYELHGAPSITYNSDKQTAIVAQALVRPV